MAHAPINTFKNEKENLSSTTTTTTDEEKNTKTSETETEVPSKPIFGTFGKNLTSKVATSENGNGDSASQDGKTEVKSSEDASSEPEVKVLFNYF